MSIWLEAALDELHGPLSDWVHYGRSGSKRELFEAYDGLAPQAKMALAGAVRKAFGGSSKAIMYRRLKSSGEASRMGGMSLTTALPGYVEAEAFEVEADDVLVHHGVPGTPLSSKAFGHEKEVILKPTANPKSLGPVPANRTAARYKDKKQVPKADGKGKTTVYEYSDRQVALRNREKAKQVEKIRRSIGDLREQVRKDLKSKDEHTRNVALAVGLLDKTYERVGNEDSAKDGHVGVTGWKVKHLTVGKDKITIKYVGKSGVKHEKVVDNAASVAAIKKAIEGKKDDDLICGCSAEDVNEYLEPFDITAKDLRGYHANTEMQTRLKRIRSENGALPKNREERKETLKEEFDQALEETAEAVGHEPSTLRSQYLVPGLEDEFMKDGEVSQTLDKRGSSVKVALREGSGLSRIAGRIRTVPTPDSLVPSSVRSFFNRNQAVFDRYPDLWLKGGAARGTFVSWAFLKLFGARAEPKEARDFDFVTFSQEGPWEVEGESVEFASSVSAYMGSRDFGVNEVLLRPDRMVFSDKAWRDVLRLEISPRSVIEEDRYGRTGLRALLFVLELGFSPGKFIAEEIKKADTWNLLLHLFKAYEKGIEDDYFLYIKKSGGVLTERIATVDDWLIELVGATPHFSLRPYHKAILDKAKEMSNLGKDPFDSIPRSASESLLQHWFASSFDRVATKTEGEKENEEVERLVKPAPKTKPPRQDLRRNRMKVEDEDVERPSAESDRDLSLNYKKVAAELTARWYGVIPPRPKPPKPPPLPPRDPIPGWNPVTLDLAQKKSRKPGDVWRSKTPGRWLAMNSEETVHSFEDRSKAESFSQNGKRASNAEWLALRFADAPLNPTDHRPGDVWESERTPGRWLGKNPEGVSKSFDTKEEAQSFAKSEATSESEAPEDGDLQTKDTTPQEPPPPPSPEESISQMVKSLSNLEDEQIQSTLESFSDAERAKIAETFAQESETLRRAFEDGTLLGSDKDLKEVSEAFENPSSSVEPSLLGKRLAQALFAKTVLANPLQVGSPLSAAPLADDQLSKRRVDSMKHFGQMSPAIRSEAMKNIHQEMTQIPDDKSEASEAKKADLQARLVGLTLAAAMKDEPCSAKVEGEWGEEDKELHPPIPPATVKLLKALDKQGQSSLVLDAVSARGTPKGREAFVKALESMGEDGLLSFAKSVDAFSDMVDVLEDSDTTSLVRLKTQAVLQDLIVNHLMFGDMFTQDALDESDERRPKKRKQKSDKMKSEPSPRTLRKIKDLNSCIRDKGFTSECEVLSLDVEKTALDDLFKDILRDIGKIPKGSEARAQMEAFQQEENVEDAQKILKTLFVQTGDLPSGARSQPTRTAGLEELWGDYLQ
jgi:DNA topoisomerase IB